MIQLLLFMILGLQDSSTFTLDTCIGMALEQSVELRNLDREREILDLQVQNIGTTYYPSLDTTFSGSYQTSVQEVSLPVPEMEGSVYLGGKDQYQAQLNVHQLVFNGHRSRYQKEQLLQQKESIRYRIEETRSELIYAVSDTYLKILETDLTMSLLNSKLDTLTSLRRDLVNRIDGGTALINGLTNTDLEIANVRYRFEKAEIEKRQLILVLGDLLGLEIGSQFQVVTDPDKLEIRVGEDLDIEEHSRVRYLESELAVLKKESNIIDSEKFPVVQAYVSVISGKPGMKIVENNWEVWGIAGINFSYELYDWDRRRRKIAVISASEEMLRDSLQDTREKTILANYRADLNMRDAQSLLKTLETGLQTAKENFEMHRNLYEAGVINATRYTESINDFEEAGIEVIKGRLEIQRARVVLKRARGEYR